VDLYVWRPWHQWLAAGQRKRHGIAMASAMTAAKLAKMAGASVIMAALKLKMAAES